MKNLILRLSVAIFALFVFVSFVEAQTRAETFAITNAQIATVSGPNLSRGTIVVRNGLIESIGENVRVPADARVIDGTGLTVYPGFLILIQVSVLPRPPRRVRQEVRDKQQRNKLHKPPLNRSPIQIIQPVCSRKKMSLTSSEAVKRSLKRIAMRVLQLF